ncbi:hypothetical protein RchiOBHm_Chr6g0254471 [Rosa chinensis]|uniref:Uncharacterized protein n=1 Tax=Rosa chinensis TaxID=74649 RepID=A0A2P6PLL6_ROSCH|nr:hypothetical protein RchiOBHm_Chr6g0254471 [Rosa chinensis]
MSIDLYCLLSQKTVWIPSEYALGYVYGGLVGIHSNWHLHSGGEAILMLSFAILGFVMKPLHLEGVQISRFTKDMKMLLVDNVYVVNVLGYIAYDFVRCAYSYWGPTTGYNINHMVRNCIGFAIEICIVQYKAFPLSSLILHIVVNDVKCLGNRTTINWLLLAATFFGEIFCFSAFCSSNVHGPVNFICLHCVKPSMIETSSYGYVSASDCINNWRVRDCSYSSIRIVFIPAAGIWFIGKFFFS